MVTINQGRISREQPDCAHIAADVLITGGRRRYRGADTADLAFFAFPHGHGARQRKIARTAVSSYAVEYRYVVIDCRSVVQRVRQPQRL